MDITNFEKPETPIHAPFAPSDNALPQQSGNLLINTPASVTTALSNAYPFILVADRVLGLLTWTSEDPWQSFLLVITWVTIVLYYETIVGVLAYPVSIAALVASSAYVRKLQTGNRPSLDEIVGRLAQLTTRANLFLEPVKELEQNIGELGIKVAFVSPIYLVISYFWLSPKTILLLTGTFLLTFHSTQARVTRAVLWRSKTIRKIVSALGLTLSPSKRLKLSNPHPVSALSVKPEGKSTPRFTFVLYEHQRKWIGVGWSSNLFTYERSNWTDEFLEEASAPSEFNLPDSGDWKWIDSAWKLDLTNDGGIPSKVKTKEDPGDDEGWVYFDNYWKKPSLEDSFSKYTRRRRWIRTAEVVKK